MSPICARQYLHDYTINSWKTLQLCSRRLSHWDTSAISQMFPSTHQLTGSRVKNVVKQHEHTFWHISGLHIMHLLPPSWHTCVIFRFDYKLNINYMHADLHDVIQNYHKRLQLVGNARTTGELEREVGRGTVLASVSLLWSTNAETTPDCLLGTATHVAADVFSQRTVTSICQSKGRGSINIIWPDPSSVDLSPPGIHILAANASFWTRAAMGLHLFLSCTAVYMCLRDTYTSAW